MLREGTDQRDDFIDDTEASDGAGSPALVPVGRDMADWRDLARRLGIASRDFEIARTRSTANGTALVDEILASRLASSDALYRALAEQAGLRYLDRIDPALIVATETDCTAALRRARRLPPVFYYTHGVSTVLVAPHDMSPVDLRQQAQHEDLKRRLTIVAPETLRAALQARHSDALGRLAVDGLARAHPDFSARHVMTARQGIMVGAFCMLAAVFGAWSLTAFMIALHLLSSIGFFACVLLRVVAALRAAPLKLARIREADPADLPLYSVLVALRDEAEIIPELLVALGKINWPRSKLEIKLVCESDDAPTLAALRAHDLHPCVEIIVVPAQLPRTKPKALAYALPQCSGEIVVLYDAEDRPHPDQLMEAWQRFQSAGPDLACLQAPLVVARSRSMIPRLFGFEYAALFRGLLPCLAAWGTVIPLGGTSNHFRREALEAAGGWDPYNVTEDADLGLRLTRCGYQIGVITHPTHENAPADYATWLPQRTRWFKGWMQTLLVHMRSPATLYRDVGPVNFLLVLVLFGGMVLSSLAHIVFVATILLLGGLFALGVTLPQQHAAILVLDVFNVLGGYAAFLILGHRTLQPSERRGFWKVALWTPVYWLALSRGAWRALWHLVRRPHEWEKTPHPRSARLVPVAEGTRFSAANRLPRGSRR